VAQLNVVSYWHQHVYVLLFIRDQEFLLALKKITRAWTKQSNPRQEDEAKVIM